MSDVEAERGGESVCWLHRVCQNCGALADEALPTQDDPIACWRCGAHEFGD